MSNLCIIKTHRNKKFATINLTAEEDKGLSWKAKGIHTYLISRPDGWEVHLTEIEKRSTDGRDGVRAGLVELHKAGYLDWHQKNESGKFFKTQYDIYEVPNAAVARRANSKSARKSPPLTENPEAVPHTALPSTENPEAVEHKKEKKNDVNKEKIKSRPHTALPVSGKSAPNIYHSNKKINNNHIYNSEPQNGSPASMPIKKNFFDSEFVLLTDAEYKKLADKYGNDFTKRLIERLDNWKGVAPKKRKYESDYRAILNWVVNAVNEDIAKENYRNGQTQRNAVGGRNFSGNAGSDASKGKLFQPGEQGQYGGESGRRNLRELLEKNSENATHV